MTTIVLPPGHSAIFGYGSLLSRASMERSLGRPYDGPFVAAEVEGWRRDWSVAMPNVTGFRAEDDDGEFEPAEIVYLNVRPHAGARVNGVLFVVSPDELRAFDRREWVYSRERVNELLSGARVQGGDAWLYVGLPEYLRPLDVTSRERAVRQTYLDIVSAALEEWGADFRDRYHAVSEPVPRHLVVSDRPPVRG